MKYAALSLIFSGALFIYADAFSGDMLSLIEFMIGTPLTEKPVVINKKRDVHGDEIV